MTKRQYKAALAVINKDCRLTGGMMEECKHGCKSPATCAVGALALAAAGGVLTRKQHKALMYSGGYTSSPFKPFISLIEQKFGLGGEDLFDIIRANDSVAGDNNIFKRRAVVRRELKSLAVHRYHLKIK